MDVTTTSTRQGKFEARFYHKIFEEEIGRVRGHFGPLSMSSASKLILNMNIDTLQTPLLPILPVRDMQVEVKMVTCGYINSTRATSISHMRLKDKRRLRDKCENGR